DLAKITVAARVREESRINRSAIIATTQKSAAIELTKTKAEIDKIDEITGRIRSQRLLREQYA
ncbi:MAG: hypothetical protein C0511_18500, partial [Hyphomicrobium sp.]|nr:hypothetical protein [Hyphomicrobium sp.]